MISTRTRRSAVPTAACRSRRALCCLAALALWPAASRAQRLTVGVEAGATRSTLRTEGSPFGWRTGRLAGVTVGLELAPWLAADVEALYVEKGAACPEVFDMRAAYLEVPLLLRLTSPRAAWGVAPLVQVGVAPARELTCGGRIRPPTLDSTQPAAAPLDCGSERTDRGDVGMVLAAGVRRRVGRVQLQATVRSTRGVRDIGSGWESVTVKNRSTALLLSGAIRAR
jgi:hypothetical protein